MQRAALFASTRLPRLGKPNARPLVSSIVLSRLYHKKVIDHYENPRNVGTLDKKDPNVGTGLVGGGLYNPFVS